MALLRNRVLGQAHVDQEQMRKQAGNQFTGLKPAVTGSGQMGESFPRNTIVFGFHFPILGKILDF
jgi:hypothetical protein